MRCLSLQQSPSAKSQPTAITECDVPAYSDVSEALGLAALADYDSIITVWLAQPLMRSHGDVLVPQMNERVPGEVEEKKKMNK